MQTGIWSPEVNWHWKIQQPSKLLRLVGWSNRKHHNSHSMDPEERFLSAFPISQAHNKHSSQIRQTGIKAKLMCNVSLFRVSSSTLNFSLHYSHHRPTAEQEVHPGLCALAARLVSVRHVKAASTKWLWLRRLIKRWGRRPLHSGETLSRRWRSGTELHTLIRIALWNWSWGSHKGVTRICFWTDNSAVPLRWRIHD